MCVRCHVYVINRAIAWHSSVTCTHLVNHNCNKVFSIKCVYITLNDQLTCIQKETKKFDKMYIWFFASAYCKLLCNLTLKQNAIPQVYISRLINVKKFIAPSVPLHTCKILTEKADKNKCQTNRENCQLSEKVILL